MALYVRRGGSGTLVMLGGGPLEARLRARTAAANLRHRVRMLGFTDPATVLGYMAACDVVVIPSRSESIPLVCSEALQMGRPLIVTDVGDVRRRHAHR
jgi:glycosyltransferase involved in cell wall biosynthesis